MPRFKYISLQPLEIRLLELHPGLPETPLAGRIVHYYFSAEKDQILQFEALSYHWGDQSDPASINLTDSQTEEVSSFMHESGSLEIGRNLASALQALRLQDKKRDLWCDSICINQQDLPERAAQVQRMKDIYRYAKSVVVWLGPDTSWSKTAMDTLRWAADQIDTATLDFSLGRDCITYKSTADEIVLKTTDPLPLTATQWLALEQLVALHWHKRLWTFQEIILADQNACVVKLGKEEIPWIIFRHTVTFTAFMRALPQNCFVDETAFVLNAELLSERGTICSLDIVGQHSWINLMDIGRLYHCTDPRDKVYALQGLVAPELAQSITPDYTQSFKDVLMSICLQDLERNKRLEFLNLCNAATRPSWIADLERPLMTSLTLDSHAAPFSPASAQVIEPGVLEVAGIPCDVLSSDPIPLAQRPMTQKDIEYREKILDIVRTFTSDSLYQDDGHLDKLIMALTYGSVRDYNMQKFQPPGEVSLRSLQDWRWKIRRWLSGTGNSMEDCTDYWLTDQQFLDSLPPAQAATGIAKTKNGDFVRVPPESRSGDIIAVFLGLIPSIVLRPQSTGYLVIGTCYHPGTSRGNALLGDDLHGWEPVWDRIYGMYVFHKEGHAPRRSDPRMDDIPMEEGYVQRVVEDGVVGWAIEGFPLEVIDPRRSEEALKRRGVPIERFRLV